jgi:hypothetical protein
VTVGERIAKILVGHVDIGDGGDASLYDGILVEALLMRANDQRALRHQPIHDIVLQRVDLGGAIGRRQITQRLGDLTAGDCLVADFGPDSVGRPAEIIDKVV